MKYKITVSYYNEVFGVDIDNELLGFMDSKDVNNYVCCLKEIGYVGEWRRKKGEYKVVIQDFNYKIIRITPYEEPPTLSLEALKEMAEESVSDFVKISDGLFDFIDDEYYI